MYCLGKRYSWVIHTLLSYSKRSWKSSLMLALRWLIDAQAAWPVEDGLLENQWRERFGILASRVCVHTCALVS